MKKRALLPLVLCLLLISGLADADQKSSWPHWRGPDKNGLVDRGNPPVEWNETRNIRWKAAIPGTGHATPLVWGDRIFVQTAVQTEKKVEDADEDRRSAPPYLFHYMVLALDRENGEVLWKKTVREAHPHQGMHPTASFASTSGTTDGVVYVTSGHRDPAMQAILLDKAAGDITESDAVLWSIHQDTPYVSSPLLYDGRLYFVKNRHAILSCHDAKTGEVLYGPQRLEGMKTVFASLVGIRDRVYISSLEGTTLVIANKMEFEILASNALDEPIAASPVVVDDELYLRGNQHLYCIAEDE